MGFVKVDLYEPGSVTLQEGRLRSVNLTHGSQGALEPGRISVSSQHSDREDDATTSGLSHIPVSTSLPRQQLLCNLRSILRKLGKLALVGDQVGSSFITSWPTLTLSLVPVFSEACKALLL
jgi:hypothetical protein